MPTSENASVRRRADSQVAGQEGFLPAAGWCNGSSPNNQGSNGNYWSSSLNTDNPNNAWNMNFNSGNHNVSNNNRNNGQSVRPVTEFTKAKPLPLLFDFSSGEKDFDTTPSRLLLDLYFAYKEARRHKRRKEYQLAFEMNLESELVSLRDAIWSRSWRPGVSSCFIIHDPKMREVFAAQFRDRVVHHLLYRYIAPFLEPGFIRDSYSCIKGRGSHDGIVRLHEKIRSVSRNWSRPCYILKLDIQGYFMHIGRERLLTICRQSLEAFRDRMDYPLVKYLLSVIVRDNPVEHCRRVGGWDEWEALPPSKSLFCSPPGCGLPIGNLTSQLFSNVYLNVFDQYMVSLVGEGHYGRYVDDAYVVGESSAALRRVIPLAAGFLEKRLGLTLSRNKRAVYSAYRGVAFLGAYLKPFRRYVANSSLSRMEKKLFRVPSLSSAERFHSVNSFLGLTSHYRAYNIRLRWIRGPLRPLFTDGSFTAGILSYKLVHTQAAGTFGRIGRFSYI